MIWSILFRVWYLFGVLWWGFCIAGTYKHLATLPNEGVARGRVSVGILAEAVLLISSFIELITT